MATNPQTDAVHQFATTLLDQDPETALAMVVEESKRQQAAADQAREEYRLLGDVEFDDQGRITKSTMAGLYRLAQLYAQSNLVPDHYKRNVPNCFIACQMAQRLGVDPFTYMQNSYVVHGKPGIEAKLLTALLNTSGKIIGRIQYEMGGEGNSRYCIASAKDKETGEILSAKVDWSMVVAEGWNKDAKTKTGAIIKSKWNTIPDVMFPYRASTFFIRRYYSEVSMGMQTVDELKDIGPPEDEATPPAPASGLDELTNRMERTTADLAERTAAASEEPDDTPTPAEVAGAHLAGVVARKAGEPNDPPTLPADLAAEWQAGWHAEQARQTALATPKSEGTEEEVAKVAEESSPTGAGDVPPTEFKVDLPEGCDDPDREWLTQIVPTGLNECHMKKDVTAKLSGYTSETGSAIIRKILRDLGDQRKASITGSRGQNSN